jgi:hypothetical protein
LFTISMARSYAWQTSGGIASGLAYYLPLNVILVFICAPLCQRSW